MPADDGTAVRTGARITATTRITTRIHVVVVGGGMAGIRLAEEIRRRDPLAERVALTVFGAEREPAYNRILLSSLLAGDATPDATRLHDPGWARAHRVDHAVGKSVDGEKRTHFGIRGAIGDDAALAKFQHQYLAAGLLVKVERQRADDRRQPLNDAGA